MKCLFVFRYQWWVTDTEQFFFNFYLKAFDSIGKTDLHDTKKLCYLFTLQILFLFSSLFPTILLFLCSFFFPLSIFLSFLPKGPIFLFIYFLLFLIYIYPSFLSSYLYFLSFVLSYFPSISIYLNFLDFFSSFHLFLILLIMPIPYFKNTIFVRHDHTIQNQIFSEFTIIIYRCSSSGTSTFPHILYFFSISFQDHIGWIGTSSKQSIFFLGL